MITNILNATNLAPLVYRLSRWHLHSLVGGNPFPVSASLYINTNCNFTCSFCNIWRVDPPYIMPEDTARDLVEQLGKLELIYFSISGGEPLMVPYVLDILGHAKRSGILYTHIVSKAFLMDKKRAQKLSDANVSEISFSIDGPEHIHNEVRGAKRSYKKILAAIQNVKTYAPNTRIVLNTILKWSEPEHALHAVQVAKDTGVSIKVQPENNHPVFEGQKCDKASKSNRGLDTDGLNNLFAAVDFMINEPCVVNSNAFLKGIKKFLVDPANLPLVNNPCILGRHHVEFFSGRMFPCLEGVNWKNGFDWKDTTLKNLFLSTEYQQSLQNLEKCNGCKKNYYVCYYEPRLNFPLGNLLRTKIL